MSEDGKLYQAAYDFQAEDDTELSMKKGDVIRVTETTDPNWWAGMYLLTNELKKKKNAQLTQSRY